MYTLVIRIIRYILRALWHCYVGNDAEFMETLYEAYKLVDQVEQKFE